MANSTLRCSELEVYHFRGTYSLISITAAKKARDLWFTDIVLALGNIFYCSTSPFVPLSYFFSYRGDFLFQYGRIVDLDDLLWLVLIGLKKLKNHIRDKNYLNKYGTKNVGI